MPEALMFRLLRYFLITSLIAFVVVVAALALFYRQVALGDLMTLQEQQHVTLTQTFANSVWPEFEPLLTPGAGRSAAELRADPAIGQLRQAVLMQIAGTTVVKIKIYNLQGLTVFSTQADQIGADQSANAGVQAARAGGVTSALTHRDRFNALDQMIEDRDVFSSYIPLRHGQDGAIVGVFEVYTDVTPFLEQIARTQLRVAGGVTALLAALYVVLFAIVRHADRIIARQAGEHQRAEEQLRRQALTFENIHDSIVITEPDGAIVDCNPATEQIFGYTRAEVIGNHLGIWYRPLQIDALQAAIVDSIAQEHRWTGDLPFVRKDGAAGVCEIVVVPLHSECGQPIGQIWVGHDITMRKRAEETLLKAKEAAEVASQAKSLFLANMSHELRTPLTAIIGYSHLIQKQLERAEQTACIPDLIKVQLAGQHLLALINDILDLSKIEAGRMALQLETFAIPELVANVVATVQPLVATNGNTLNVECPPDLGIMYADPIKVRQILLNLLSNAAKFTERGQIDLTVACERAGGAEWVRFGVADTGVGIPPRQIHQLFQAFTQGDSSATRRYGGVGLGLTISRRFCEMMGGRIAVASEPGVGSTFVVYLPATVAGPPTEAEKLLSVAAGRR
jgi:PAS domain S-box-containing protein